MPRYMHDETFIVSEKYEQLAENIEKEMEKKGRKCALKYKSGRDIILQYYEMINVGDDLEVHL